MVDLRGESARCTLSVSPRPCLRAALRLSFGFVSFVLSVAPRAPLPRSEVPLRRLGLAPRAVARTHTSAKRVDSQRTGRPTARVALCVRLRARSWCAPYPPARGLKARERRARGDGRDDPSAGGGGRALSSHHPRQEGAAPVLYESSSRIANCEKCGGSTAAAAGPRPAGRLVRGTRSSGTTGQKHNAGRQRSFRFYSRTRRHEGPRLKW